MLAVWFYRIEYGLFKETEFTGEGKLTPPCCRRILRDVKKPNRFLVRSSGIPFRSMACNIDRAATNLTR